MANVARDRGCAQQGRAGVFYAGSAALLWPTMLFRIAYSPSEFRM